MSVSGVTEKYYEKFKSRAFDMIWYVIWCDKLWYYMIWYDMIWYMMWYGMILYYVIFDVIWYDMIWYKIWYDIILYDIWCDMIWYMIWYDMIYLTAIGFTPGGSSSVHIYTQIIHRTTETIRRTT
jgi:hypothetical protein